MADEFTMPKLGLTMTEGIIRSWLVEDGTFVRAGDPVLMIETDKVETEVEARSDGFLRITGVVGSTYQCGDVIGLVFDAADTVTGGLEPQAEPPADAAPADEEPELAEVVSLAAREPAVASPVQQPAAPAPVAAMGAAGSQAVRGEHGRILASPRARAAASALGIDLDHIEGSGPGGRILHDDVVDAARLAAERAEAERLAAEQAEAERAEAERAEIERLAAERAEAERLAAERLAAERAEMERLAAEQAEAERPAIEVGADGGRAELERLESDWFASDQSRDEDTHFTLVTPPEPKRHEPVVPPEPATADEAVIPATGGARLLADFLGVDLADVPSTSGQKLTREDVGAWVRERLRTAPHARHEVAEAAPLLQQPSSVIPFEGMRGLIAQRMHGSLHEMAQLTLSVDVDMSGVNAERERRRQRGDTVPGYTAWVVAAAAQALGAHPYVNSQVTADGLALLPDVHVGVAVALDEGLIVPVIDHADVRSVEETHQVVADLASRARNRKLSLAELEGATFSVTALGMFGVDVFTPVINPPNTAILGVGRLRSETAWMQGQPAERTVMTLSLTWDHRAFDGAPAAEFAQTIVRALEEPTELV